MSSVTDIQKAPGRVVVKRCRDKQWPWYWHAYVGDERVNGGLAATYDDGIYRGRQAIYVWRKQDWMQNYIFDHETGKWYRRGTEPPS